jgi:hypothetical protein
LVVAEVAATMTVRMVVRVAEKGSAQGGGDRDEGARADEVGGERLDSGTESADGAAYIVAVAGVLIE